MAYFQSDDNFYKMMPIEFRPLVCKDEILSTYGLQLLFNYIPKHSNFRYGINYNSVSLALERDETSDAFLILGQQSELGFDISYAHKDLMDITLGFGRMWEHGLTATEEVAFGIGGSVRWYRPMTFISSPTPGLHFTPSTGNVAVSFSTSFY